MESILFKEQPKGDKLFGTNDNLENNTALNSTSSSSDSTSSSDNTVNESASKVNDESSSSNSSGWNIRFHFGHLIVFWSAILGMLFSSYLFGLFKGRGQGLEHALRTQQDLSLRLPLQSELTGSSNKDLENSRASFGPEVLNTLRDGHTSSPKKLVSSSKSSNLAEPLTSDTKYVTATDISKGWYVQIVAANSLREAEAVVAKLTQSKLLSIIEKANLKKIEYFRVLSGPFPDRKESIKKQTEIRKLEIPASAPFIREVK